MGVILKRPERVHDLNPSYRSRWGSNRQPYIFYLKRTDLQVTIQNQVGICVLVPLAQDYGVIDPQAIPIPTTVTLCVGNDIWNVTTYTGTVTGFTASGDLITDIPYVTGMNVTGAYINWNYLEAYKIYLKVTGYIPSISNVELFGELVGTPDKSGLVRFDIRTLLERRMVNVNKCTFTNVTQLEYSGWNYFWVNYRWSFFENNIFYETQYTADEQEIFNGVTQQLRYYTVNGSKYLLSKYGQNYADYEPQRVTGIYAKFLTLFKNPVYFVGYPFSLTYIRSRTLINNSCTREEDELNVNGSVVNHNDITISGKIPIGLHQLTLNGTYVDTVTQLDVWLESGGIASNNYVEDDYVQDNYTQDTVGSIGTVYRVTEKKRVLVDRECRKNPVYLMWKNVLGGWDFWLFDKVNETSYTAKQNGTYGINVDDIERQTYREKVIGNTQTVKYLLGDTIKPEQVEGLAQIEMSPQVYILWDSTKLTTEPELAWLGVNIVPKGVKYTSREKDVDIEVNIELPEYYNISN